MCMGIKIYKISLEIRSYKRSDTGVVVVVNNSIPSLS